jgi:purine nucleosidase
MSEMIPVLFDTDIGNDIDDAVALAYLLKQPRCELLGVTTATGDTAKRAALVEVLCRVANREDVPIHAGLSGPLLFGQEQGVAQYAAIENLPHKKDWGTNADTQTILFLREMIRSRPNEITLLATGPMTNIGVLFALDPELPSLLKSIVLMCGVFLPSTPNTREWNAYLDPIATALTYKAAKNNLVSVGLDVTLQCRMDKTECRAEFAKSEPLATVLKMAEVWFTHASEITFHDPLAAALIFEPGLCGVEVGTINTITEHGPNEGHTLWKVGPSGPHQIATSVDVPAFFKHYFAITS